MKFHTQKCSHCGKDFPTYDDRMVYCSPECRTAARREKNAAYRKANYQKKKAEQAATTE